LVSAEKEHFRAEKEHFRAEKEHFRAEKEHFRYETWYRSKRQRFDRFWGRWHFGVRRLGLRGLLARALHTFR
jgi:hypothetical protein